MRAVIATLFLTAWFGVPLCQAWVLPYPNPFKHVIIIVQENRTPDNLFQGLCSPPYGTSSSCSTTPSASQYNIQTKDWLDKTSPVGLIQPTSVPLAGNYDLGHYHNSFTAQYDGGKMDGAAGVPCSQGPCPSNPQFKYVDNSSGTVNPYLDLATQYGWANYMFQTNQGGSYPAHLYIFGGSSAPSASDDADGILVAENPYGTNLGCLTGSSNSSEYDLLISPQTAPREYKLTNDSLGALCFTKETMASVLDQANVTWKYYAATAGWVWTPPNTSRAICEPNSDYTECTGSEWAQNVDLNPADVLSDIGACKLSNVSWVTPTKKNSDHPGNEFKDTGGPSWVSSIVNAIGGDTNCEGGKGYWSDTAIVITWDDWGGWYDHVKPPIRSGNQGDYEYGFRVPMIVVSAYTPQHYINNTSPHDFGTILRFIEGVFNIKEGALGFADARGNGDLNFFFNFEQSARSFKKIAAPLDANHFLHEKPSTEPPDEE